MRYSRSHFVPGPREETMVYTTIVLSSGGVRGVAYAGAIDELVRLAVVDLEHVTLFVGTSIGALFAAFLAVGMDTAAILAVAQTVDLANLVQVNLMTFLYAWGLDDKARLRAFVAQHVCAFTGSASTTLGALLRSRGVNLRVCVSNLTLNRPEYFCGETVPDLGVVDAVLMSMALPPVFTPVTYRDMLYIDGAFLDSFPLHGLDPASTLGLRLDWKVACNLTSVEQFYSRLVFCALRYAEKVHTGFDVVHINVGNISTVNLTLPQWNLRCLVDDGRYAAGRFALHEALSRALRKPAKEGVDLPKFVDDVHQQEGDGSKEDKAPCGDAGVPGKLHHTNKGQAQFP